MSDFICEICLVGLHTCHFQSGPRNAGNPLTIFFDCPTQLFCDVKHSLPCGISGHFIFHTEYFWSPRGDRINMYLWFMAYSHSRGSIEKQRSAKKSKPRKGIQSNWAFFLCFVALSISLYGAIIAHFAKLRSTGLLIILVAGCS